MLFVAPAGSLKRQQTSQVAGSVAVTIAAMALIGWWAKLPMLSSWGAGFAPTKPVTALCLTALGLALVHPGKNMRVAFAIGLAVAAVAAPDLALDLFGVDLGIDHWLMPRVPGPETASFIDMTPVAIALAGGSLALSHFEGNHLAATALGGLAGIMALFAVIGYLTGIYTPYGSASVNAPSLPTAVGLLCVVGAIVLRTGAMPALRKPRPLWHLLAMLGCAIVAPLLLFCAYAGFRIVDAQLRDDLEDLTTETRTLSAAVDREIIGEIERLQALAASPSLRQGDFAEFQRQAEASLALRQSGNIMLIDRNMQQIVNTWVPFGTHLEKAAVPEPAQMALATGRPQVTGLFMGPVVKQLLIGIIVPVQIEGESRYALVRSPNPHALAGLVAANQLPPGWHAVVSDATHRVIAGSQGAFIGQELPPTQRHRAGSGRVFEFIDSEGRPSLQAYAWSELTGWQTAVWAPKALLQAPVQALWWSLGYIALLAFAIVVTLALWLGLIIARSIGHAARAAIASGEDGPVLPSETPVAEVNALMAELRERTDLLRDSERQLRLVTDNVQVALAYCDREARYKFVNRHYAERRGLTPEQVVGKSVLEVVGEKAWATFDPYFRECLAGKAIEFELEVDLPCASEPQFVHCSYVPEWRDDKVVGLIAAITNITGLKRAEAAVHFLMREVNHRAKNMLSVVQAIAHQTVASNPEDFVERFSERIQALSANQDLLVRNEWKGVEIEDLVQAQLAPFADLVGSRVAVHGPKLRLNPASAQAIGLALHELATNAGKYGALSKDIGRVDISWGIVGDTFTMSWTEREGPPVSPPERRGFGTTVMKATTERSVDGKVDLDYAPSGVTWRLTCPTTSALEPGKREANFKGR
jgi:PAS domain S-box-containing protein